MGLPAKEAETYFFYRQVIGILNRHFVSFLLGGGFGFEFYTYIGRSITVMDIFMSRKSLERAFNAREETGFRT